MPNEQVVRDIYAAFDRGDLPAILGNLAEDVVWETEGPASISFAGIRNGKVETVGFFQALASDHVNPQLTVSDLVSSGDVVMTLGRYAGTIKATGKKFDSPIAHYWKFRDGKVIRYVGLVNTAAIVEAQQPSTAAATK